MSGSVDAQNAGFETTASLSSGVTDPAQKLRASFFEYNRSVRVANSKIACMLVVVLMPVGVLLDLFVYPSDLSLFLLLRVSCSLTALGLWMLLGTNFGHRYFRLLGMGWFILPALFISLMIYFEGGIASPYYAGLNLVLIGMAWAGQVDFIESIAATVLTLLMYLGASLANGAGTVSQYFNNFYFIALTGFIVITGSFFLNRLRFREYALRAELDDSRRELQESNAKLVELDRAKTSFFANVSHELRTPLTLLIGPLERLRHGNPPVGAGERTELLDIMYNNSMRLLRLINDLLDLVRLDSGVLRVRRVKAPLRPFVTGIANSVSHMARQRNLTFSAPMDEQLNPELSIDWDKLEKIILNLLFNSFKFTPAGGSVEIQTEYDGRMVSFTVRDSGKGIAEADLPRIFDRFWQAEAAVTRKYQGVGIGLALVKELAEAHGGSVSVQSAMGQGTIIRVSVDASDEDRSTLESEPGPMEPEGAPAEWLTQLYRRADLFPAHVITKNEHASPVAFLSGKSKPLVLVADDEPEMRRFLVSQLSGIYHLIEARNGSEALTLTQEHDFSLILLDLMMPGIDGITLTRTLREQPRTSSVPIIILTARADGDSKMQALEAGVTDFLTKPFASSELAIRCRNLMFQRGLQEKLSGKTRELEMALEQIKDSEAQLVHQAKMASLGQLSSGLMHEINNPLNFANTAAHLLQKRLQKFPPEDRDPLLLPLKDLHDGIRRVADIVSGLRSFVHPDTGNFRQISLRQVIDSSVRFVQIPATEICVTINVPEELRVWGNANQLIHLMINLLQNAVDSLREKGASEKRISINASLQSDRVLLTCEDNGKGIKSGDQEKVFDAFFTTKPVGSGMGLGLNISYRIIENHFGTLSVESQENEFCRFVINLNQTKPTI